MPSKQYKEKPGITRKGLVILYIGDGKGKTSAAMGLAVRASGAGMNVCILQFVKAKKPDRSKGEHLESGEWPLSNEIVFFNEARTPKNLGVIDTEQVGAGFVGILGDKKDRDQHVRAALQGLERARQIIASNEYQVVILDELASALELNLIELQDVLDLITIKPEMVHLVLTGHKRIKKLIEACDLVTEMKMIKHPYYKGILAQRGIDF